MHFGVSASADLQKEWDELAGALYKTLENRGIDAHDMFLKGNEKASV